MILAFLKLFSIHLKTSILRHITFEPVGPDSISNFKLNFVRFASMHRFNGKSGKMYAAMHVFEIALDSKETHDRIMPEVQS